MVYTWAAKGLPYHDFASEGFCQTPGQVPPNTLKRQATGELCRSPSSWGSGIFYWVRNSTHSSRRIAPCPGAHVLPGRYSPLLQLSPVDGIDGTYQSLHSAGCLGYQGLALKTGLRISALTGRRPLRVYFDVGARISVTDN